MSKEMELYNVHESTDQEKGDDDISTKMNDGSSSSGNEEDVETIAITTAINAIGGRKRKSQSPSIGLSSAKKKLPSVNINLLTFIKYVHRTCIDIVSNDIQNTEEFKTCVRAYVDHFYKSVSEPLSYVPAKKLLSEPEAVDKDTTKKCVMHKNWRSIVMAVLMEWFCALELYNVSMLFSREYLKYFLATHDRWVVISDFVNTNVITKKTSTSAKSSAMMKKQKNITKLNNGAVLIEYAKSPSSFASNLSRCETSDVEAVQYIVENAVSLHHKIYKLMTLVQNFEDAKYTVDTEPTEREDYVSIPIQNFKRSTLIITGAVVLMYDGIHLTIPNAALEKDITTEMILNCPNLTHDKYIVLDVLLGTKIKVLDIICCNISDVDVNVCYNDRLELIKSLLKNVKIATSETAGILIESSYIQKAIAFGKESFIFYKPNHTAVPIGVKQGSIMFAYINDNQELMYKFVTKLSGNAAVAVSVLSFSNKDAAEVKTIKLYNFASKSFVTMKILGLENESDYTLFSTTVGVEMKDNNKMGNISHNAITNVKEYKLPQSKDSANMTLSIDNLTEMMNNPNNIDMFVKAINKSQQYTNILKHLRIEASSVPNIDLNF